MALDGVLADHAARAADRHAGQLARRPSCSACIDRLMPGAMTPPSKAPSAPTTSKVVAVPLSMTISGAAVERGSAPTALTSRSAPASDGLVDPHLDAELDVLADHQRLDLQIAARQVAQVEQRLRHHAGDDAGVEVAELQRLHAAAAGAARRRIRRRCAWPRWRCATGRSSRLAVVDGEQGVGVALFDGQQHRLTRSRRRRRRR